jgi:mannose-6-phosphate isomerase-like protein (cupin superfamily)
MANIDPDKIAADWAERGFSCDLWVDPPGQHWENFVHKVDEVVIVLEGEMEFEIEGKAYRPKIGEEVLIPAKVVHSSRNIGKTISRWLYGYKTLDS